MKKVLLQLRRISYFRCCNKFLKLSIKNHLSFVLKRKSCKHCFKGNCSGSCNFRYATCKRLYNTLVHVDNLSAYLSAFRYKIKFSFYRFSYSFFFNNNYYNLHYFSFYSLYNISSRTGNHYIYIYTDS